MGFVFFSEMLLFFFSFSFYFRARGVCMWIVEWGDVLFIFVCDEADDVTATTNTVIDGRLVHFTRAAQSQVYTR